MLIRSYRRVFDLERRIYRVDRIRLNPGGVPVRGIIYFIALLLLALLCTRLPLVGLIAGVLPIYVRYLALPALLGALLAVVRIEGRPFHLAIRAMLRCSVGSITVVGLRRSQRAPARSSCAVWRPRPLLMIPDGSDARVRRLRYRGPGAVLVTVAHERHVGRGPLVALGLRPQLALRSLPAAERPSRGEVIVLSRRGRLTVR
jgi:hypothetical protein